MNIVDEQELRNLQLALTLFETPTLGSKDISKFLEV